MGKGVKEVSVEFKRESKILNKLTFINQDSLFVSHHMIC